jgi:uncharacterized protein
VTGHSNQYLYVMRILVAVLSFLVLPLTARASAIPSFTDRVTDLAHILDSDQKIALETHLRSYEKRTSHQFAVLTIDSLHGESIEAYSIRVVEAWQLGMARKDDGLLLLIAVGDRKMRIEVGRGLEGSITDAQSSTIINEIIKPAFQRGAYAEGIDSAMTTLMTAAGQADVDAAQKAKPSPIVTLVSWFEGVLQWLFYHIGIALLVLAVAIRRNRHSRRLIRSGKGAGGGNSEHSRTAHPQDKSNPDFYFLGFWSGGSNNPGTGENDNDLHGGGGGFSGGGASGGW